MPSFFLASDHFSGPQQADPRLSPSVLTVCSTVTMRLGSEEIYIISFYFEYLYEISCLSYLLCLFLWDSVLRLSITECSYCASSTITLISTWHLSLFIEISTLRLSLVLQISALRLSLCLSFSTLRFFTVSPDLCLAWGVVRTSTQEFNVCSRGRV